MDSTAEIAKWFWSIVTEFENVQRAKLLQYVTGSSRVPISGFGALRGEFSTKLMKINLFL